MNHRRTSALSARLTVTLAASLLIGGCDGRPPRAAGSSECATQPSVASARDLFEPNPAPPTLRVSLASGSGGRLAEDNALAGFGCTGKNVSPAVSWDGAPSNTKSFAVVMHDPDAPTGVGFFHWTVFDVPQTKTSLVAAASPKGLPAGTIEGYTDYGATGYGGPCPPPGETHRYIVTVYALDVPQLGAPPSSTGALVRFMLRGHTLALGRATATFRRPAPASSDAGLGN